MPHPARFRFAGRRNGRVLILRPFAALSCIRTKMSGIAGGSHRPEAPSGDSASLPCFLNRGVYLHRKSFQACGVCNGDAPKASAPVADKRRLCQTPV